MPQIGPCTAPAKVNLSIYYYEYLNLKNTNTVSSKGLCWIYRSGVIEREEKKLQSHTSN